MHVPHVDDPVNTMQNVMLLYIGHGENYTMQFFIVLKGAKDRTTMKLARTLIYFSSLKTLSLPSSDSSPAPAPCMQKMMATPHRVLQMMHG